jgi:sulfite reductase (ferredoxin)
MPSLIREVQEMLTRHELESLELAPHIRMTGCPNGCARPYSAEIGLVGRGVNSYAVYLGGSHLGTRLSEVWLDNVPREQMIATLEPLFVRFKTERLPLERFGDYCHRVGLDSLNA